MSQPQASDGGGGSEAMSAATLAQRLEQMSREFEEMKARAEAQERQQTPQAQVLFPPNFFAEIAGMHTPSIVARYSGERPDSLIRWLKEYKSQAVSLGWDDSIKLRRLGAHLEGRAREVFEDAQRAAGVNFSFEQAEAALTNTFAKGFWQDAARARLQVRVQRKGETVFAFYRELRDEAEIAYGDLPPESRSRTLLSLFINGLRPNIRSFVFANNPRDEKEALDFAVKCENAPFLSEQAVEPARVASVVAHGSDLHVLRDELCALRDQLSELTRQVASLGRTVAQIQDACAVASPPSEKGSESKFTPPKSLSKKSEAICRNCLLPGHFSRECNAPLATRNGGRYGGTNTKTRVVACVRASAGDSPSEPLACEDEADYPMLGAQFVNWVSEGEL